MDKITIFTIGFTQKSASTFFTTLKNIGVKKLIDTRLNNVSQLAGYAKRDDLNYFLKEICNIPYLHDTNLAPTKDILDNFKKGESEWMTYEQEFINLIEKRKIEKLLNPEEMDGACLLCSEHLPHHCHRRLVAEYLQKKWGNVHIEHLK